MNKKIIFLVAMLLGFNIFSSSNNRKVIPQRAEVSSSSNQASRVVVLKAIENKTPYRMTVFDKKCRTFKAAPGGKVDFYREMSHVEDYIEPSSHSSLLSNYDFRIEFDKENGSSLSDRGIYVGANVDSVQLQGSSNSGSGMKIFTGNARDESFYPKVWAFERCREYNTQSQSHASSCIECFKASQQFKFSEESQVTMECSVKPENASQDIITAGYSVQSKHPGWF